MASNLQTYLEDSNKQRELMQLGAKALASCMICSEQCSSSHSCVKECKVCVTLVGTVLKFIAMRNSCREVFELSMKCSKKCSDQCIGEKDPQIHCCGEDCRTFSNKLSEILS
eukprot:TRINITY_DN7685_c0_g2_i3.p1 TRINITY_DN7685_c0_g2~~TRINITY_DN7685_c0_g2_i3.p1  ORF type:complete len:112 (+),score=8.45 TRINITY_DN7685_c0_g2_i3:152-487(+)